MVKKTEEGVNPIVNGLLARRTVVLEGEINYKSISEVSAQLLELQLRSNDTINLIINSGGGSLYPALELCDLMTNFLTAPVRGIVIGSCASAATFIILHCAERLATRHARFLLHSGNAGKLDMPIGRATLEAAEQMVRDLKVTEELVLALYSNRLTPAVWQYQKVKLAERREFVQKLIDRGDQRFDCWMMVTEAIEVGLVTEVITKKLDIFRAD